MCKLQCAYVAVSDRTVYVSACVLVQWGVCVHTAAVCMYVYVGGVWVMFRVCEIVQCVLILCVYVCAGTLCGGTMCVCVLVCFDIKRSRKNR